MRSPCVSVMRSALRVHLLCVAVLFGCALMFAPSTSATALAVYAMAAVTMVFLLAAAFDQWRLRHPRTNEVSR